MKLLKTIADLINNILIGSAFLLGALVMYGDWPMLYGYWTKKDHHTQIATNDDTTNFPFRSFQTNWIYSMILWYGIYFIQGLFFHYYYYKLRRDRSDEWKCQPNRWLPNEMELDAIEASLTTILVANTWSALLSTYISNGGYYANVYFKWNEYSLLYLILQGLIAFVVSDYALYWTHRTFHRPILYKMFHSVHHKYLEPTVFITNVIHPFEMIVMVCAAVLPLFNPIFPIYWPTMVFTLYYIYVIQMFHHSGVNFKSLRWQPWQPETMFHDNHHKYFHGNFGFNTKMWDRMHGTIRQADRIYTEKTFWDKGELVHEANEEEKAEHLRERETENEEAHTKGCDKVSLFLKDEKYL